MSGYDKKYQLRNVAAKMDNLQDTLSSELVNLRKEVEIAKASNYKDAKKSIFDELLQKFNDFENKFLSSLHQIKSDVNKLMEKQEEVYRMSESNTNKAYAKNFILHGIPESLKEDLMEIVIDLISEKLHCNILKNDINTVYRIGKKEADKRKKPRIVVVEFMCQWKRDEVYRCKKCLKGSGLVITEMLTKSTYTVFMKFRSHFKNQCWTDHGKILVYVNNNIVVVNEETDLNSLINKQASNV